MTMIIRSRELGHHKRCHSQRLTNHQTYKHAHPQHGGVESLVVQKKRVERPQQERHKNETEQALADVRVLFPELGEILKPNIVKQRSGVMLVMRNTSTHAMKILKNQPSEYELPILQQKRPFQRKLQQKPLPEFRNRARHVRRQRFHAHHLHNLRNELQRKIDLLEKH